MLAATNSTDSECGEYRGLNTPVQPMTPAGRLLSSVLLNDPEYFPQVVQKQLEQLVVDRYEALARMNLSSASDESCLHRYSQYNICLSIPIIAFFFLLTVLICFERREFLVIMLLKIDIYM